MSYFKGMTLRYNPSKIEKKWQARWLKEKIYEPDLKRAKKPFYNLMMFPYPSAEGLHVGNMYAFTGADIYGRMKRMQGYDVFEPIGLDGFGIHSENYALKIGKHPATQAKISEKNFYRQLSMIGNSYAWREHLETYDPEYYRWTQWIFIQMFKRGLAYRRKARVNWCPSCLTVLADEQVVSGECERCATTVIKKELEQWFFRITNYAERLLNNLDSIDWSQNVKIAQRNWIGKTEGAEIQFPISHFQFSIKVFTARPDTIFGATYLVLAPEHSLLKELSSQIENWKDVRIYIAKAGKKNNKERSGEEKEKTGMALKGITAINPARKEEIPVWISNYVLGNVGTGAVMGVPAHDERDFEFAKKFDLPIKMVVCPHYPEKTCSVLNHAYTGEGHLVDSGKFDGMRSEEARQKIIDAVAGTRRVSYRLRDWLISRQRYWGPPIPIIYCRQCWLHNKKPVAKLRYGVEYSVFDGEEFMIHMVPENNLPVRLPFIKNFRPTGTDKSPLAGDQKFFRVRCPTCGSPAFRETDVSDTFLDSAWYYLRYPSYDEKHAPWNPAITKKWCPVAMCIGGAEHAVLHLLYVRFLAHVLKDAGLIRFAEPFTKFRAHGLLIKDGAKMSKSRGNVVNPDDYIRAYGADALRMYLMFLGPFEQGGDFSDTGIRGITRFLERVNRLITTFHYPIRDRSGDYKDEIEKLLHKTTKKVTEDIESLQYNTAISSLMILFNMLEDHQEYVSIKHIKVFLKLLAPFAPHLTEELWQECVRNREPKGGSHRKNTFSSVHREPWPKFNPEFLQEEMFELVVQINGKVRGRVMMPIGVGEKEVRKAALALEGVKQYVPQEPRKIIFIPNKLINFVV